MTLHTQTTSLLDSSKCWEFQNHGIIHNIIPTHIYRYCCTTCIYRIFYYSVSYNLRNVNTYSKNAHNKRLFGIDDGCEFSIFFPDFTNYLKFRQFFLPINCWKLFCYLNRYICTMYTVLQRLTIHTHHKYWDTKHIKFIYSEKATKFCEISTVDLTVNT